MGRQPKLRRGTMLAVFMLIALNAPKVSAQTEIVVEKATNGVDADSPPGPVLLVGDPVAWTYIVTNTGARDLANISVNDDQGVTVTCPATTLSAGESMVCTGNGTAQEGQYANVGTADAELPDGTPVSDSDPSHYFGQAPTPVGIEKATNGVDADSAPGPSLPVGAVVTWAYEVTNTGSEPLTEVEVTDDQGVTVTCPKTTLTAGESMTCTGNGIVQPGQYANVGSVTASLPDESPVGDSDPSHYFGQVLSLGKATNGQDADVPPGPVLLAGSAVIWTYEVTNPGPAPVTGLEVTDDQGVTVTCPQTTLAAGESMTCTGSGSAQAGQYANVGTAAGYLPTGARLSASDPSHHLGVAAGIDLEKATNGHDADTAPGPYVRVGDPLTWTYRVTNTGAVALTGVSVTDDQGVAVTCPKDGLEAGEAMTCSAAGVAEAGQQANTGTASGNYGGGLVYDTDPSHYVGIVAAPVPAVGGWGLIALFTVLAAASVHALVRRRHRLQG